MAEKTKAWLDSRLGKFISRTLMVFLFGSGLLLGQYITAEQWQELALLYIGTQKSHDIVLEILKAKYGL